MPRHILIKLTKTKHKERRLKVEREKQQVTYKGNLINLITDLSAETLQARREWQDIFKVLKGKNLQPRLLYLARISFTIDGEIKSFSDKQVNRIQYHQASLKTNVKGTYIVKKLWCWEGLRAGGKGDDRGWDSWMASSTWWTWVCMNSGRWWWTWRPGMLRFMGLQRVGHVWATELNWTELIVKKYKRRKKIYKINPKQLRKWQ